MYGSVIRETGWTVLQLERQPAADVFDLLGQMGEHPPAHIILAAVHLEQKSRKTKKNSPRDVQEVASMLGCRTLPITPEVRSQIDQIRHLEAAFHRKKK